LALFTIGETPWSGSQRATILDRLRSGGLSVLAIHSATDACYGWDDYARVVGARFDGHPWTQTVDLEVVAPDHPATAHLGERWRWHDEVYQFRDLRQDAEILLRVPPMELDLGARHNPGSASRSPGAAKVRRTFSTSLGHFPGAWESPAYLRHLAGGLAWALDARA
jgi:type 1 glutamine amidotransferase